MKRACSQAWDVNDKGMHWEKHWKKVAKQLIVIYPSTRQCRKAKGKKRIGNDSSVTQCSGCSKVVSKLYFSLNCK